MEPNANTQTHTHTDTKILHTGLPFSRLLGRDLVRRGPSPCLVQHLYFMFSGLHQGVRLDPSTEGEEDRDSIQEDQKS